MKTPNTKNSNTTRASSPVSNSESIRGKTLGKKNTETLRGTNDEDGSDNDETLSQQLEEIRIVGKMRFDKAMNSWQKVRLAALEDLRFYEGEDFTMDLQKQSNIRNEPLIGNNRLPNYVKNIENNIRKMEISVNVYPTDEIASEDTAQIFAGMIRDIERKSHAPSQYIHAAGENGALVPGFGFIRLATVNANKSSFNQEIRIEAIRDPFTILPDADCVEPDSSDAQCWFEFSDYSNDEYRRLFPDSTISSAQFNMAGAKIPDWIGGEGIRVCKYWYKEEMEAIEYLLEDGSVVNNMGWYDPNEAYNSDDEDRSADKAFDKSDKKPIISPILRRRTVLDSKVKWVIFNGCEVLGHGEWLDNEFPFVSVFGPMMIVNGQKKIRGIIRYAKDSQKMLTYLSSSIIRRIASANKSPWIASAKQIKGHEQYWKTANTNNFAALIYNDTDPDNPTRVLNPPTRADQQGQINDLIQASAKVENDLAKTIGIFDAGIGATPNEQSGVAIKTLAQEGQDSNAHFGDSLTRAVERLGHLLVRLIPKVYDTPRVVRTIGADNNEKMTRINQIFTENNKQQSHFLSEGEYNVGVSCGPAYATRKQQTLEQLIKLAQHDPNLLPVIQDIIVGELDMDKSKVLQDRLGKLFAERFPQLAEKPGQEDIPPAVQAQMGQMNQMIQQLTQELHQTHDTLQALQVEKMSKQIEHQHRMQEIEATVNGKIAEAKARGFVQAGLHKDEAADDIEMQKRDAVIAAAMKQLDHAHETRHKLIDLAANGKIDTNNL